MCIRSIAPSNIGEDPTSFSSSHSRRVKTYMVPCLRIALFQLVYVCCSWWWHTLNFGALFRRDYWVFVYLVLLRASMCWYTKLGWKLFGWANGCFYCVGRTALEESYRFHLNFQFYRGIGSLGIAKNWGGCFLCVYPPLASIDGSCDNNWSVDFILHD